MEYCLSCNSYYEDENFYWFAEQQYNGFYQVDKKTLTPELLFHFPEEEIETELLFSQVLKEGDWFVFAPQRGKQIILYHGITKEIKTIPLAPVEGEKKVKYNQNVKFSSMVSFEGKVYLFPFTYPAIVVLDLEKMTITYLTHWVDQVEKGVEEQRSSALALYFRCALLEAGKVYLPTACSKQMMIFDLKNHQVECVTVSKKEAGFNGIAFDGKHFWLSPLTGKEIVKWSPNGSEIIVLEKELHESFYVIHSPLLWRNRLFFLAGFQHKTYEVDIDTKEVKVNALLSKELPQKQALQNLHGFMILPSYLVGTEFHFICGNDRNWYTYDLEKDVLSKKVILMDAVGVEIMRKRNVFRTEISSATLMDFCSFVVERETDGTQGKAEMTIGEKVLRATT